MAYNNGFPMSYQPMYYPQQYQTPLQQQYIQQPVQQSQQMMTPPTIRAEIVQIDSESAAENYPLSAGSSQMMIAKDETAIYVKTMYPNGQYKLDAFIKRPETPKINQNVSDIYITREEFESRIREILEAKAEKSKAEPKKAKAEGDEE